MLLLRSTAWLPQLQASHSHAMTALSKRKCGASKRISPWTSQNPTETLPVRFTGRPGSQVHPGPITGKRRGGWYDWLGPITVHPWRQDSVNEEEGGRAAWWHPAAWGLVGRATLGDSACSECQLRPFVAGYLCLLRFTLLTWNRGTLRVAVLAEPWEALIKSRRALSAVSGRHIRGRQRVSV